LEILDAAETVTDAEADAVAATCGYAVVVAAATVESCGRCCVRGFLFHDADWVVAMIMPLDSMTMMTTNAMPFCWPTMMPMKTDLPPKRLIVRTKKDNDWMRDDAAVAAAAADLQTRKWTRGRLCSCRGAAAAP